MKVVADENIPFAAEAFGTLGGVTLVRGRAMTAKLLADADILLVRSVTKVDRDLLEGSHVRFVATATIGTDHIDTDYLDKRGIGFASAPGSNATSVAEYVTAALLVLAKRGGYRLQDKSIGVVGVGNVGSRVATRAEALGMKVLLNDPPLARKTHDEKYLPLTRLFEADFLTIHTPLAYGGPDPTYQIVNEEFVATMKPGSVLVNTARGQIAETRALKRALDSDQLSEVVLDVWENEPNPNTGLIERAAIATPHIAGYGLDGKVRGTEMIYTAACSFLGKAPLWEMADVLPTPRCPNLEIDADGRQNEDVFREVVLDVCDIEGDDARMRDILTLPEAKRPAFFDKLRKTYPVRREFHNTCITLKHAGDALVGKLRALGFRIDT
ncbi:MAG: 4-phosphoerythronate dehydrogenase [Planctomycetes bacterium]|nr:4-phosphoerythronate dehydrogenase [Planctomycetota bacterium]